MATPNKNLSLPANSSASWDQPLNNNASIIDVALGSTQAINVTGNATTPIMLGAPALPLNSCPPMTNASYLPLRLAVSGSLSQATQLQVPHNVSGIWIVYNGTNAAYPLTFGVTGGSSSATLAPGVESIVISDGNNAALAGPVINTDSVHVAGDYKWSASPNAQTGWLLCYGQAVSRTTYAALFAAIGGIYGSGDGSTTFNLPDGRGRTLVGADNMGGGAAGRLPGYTIGVTGGAATVSLTGDQNGPHNHSDYGHGHADNGHTHDSGTHTTTAYGAGFAGALSAGGNGSISTGVGYASITTGYANISVSGSGNPHANVQPSLAGYLYIYTGT